MAITLGLQGDMEAMTFCGILFAIIFVWLLFNWFVVRKVDPELSVEVARILLPAGAILSLTMSGMLSMVLEGMIPGSEGKEHWILPFVGVGVAIFLGVRSLDIKWLRGEEEILMLEERKQ